MKPTLIALDFARRSARRYIPATADHQFSDITFAQIGQPDEPMAAFGDKEGLGIIEKFRVGLLTIAPAVSFDDREQA